MERKGFFNSELLTKWDKIVGAVLADHTRPIKIIFPKNTQRNGTLHLSVTTGFAIEVQHFEPQIIEKMNMYYGFKAIDRISIKQNLPYKKIEKKKTSHILKEKNKTKDDKAMPKEYKSIEDENLRNALKRLGELI